MAHETTPVPERHTPSRRWLLTEIPVVYALSGILTVVLTRAAHISPFVGENVSLLVGAMFMGLPMALLLWRRESLDDYGLPPETLWREVAFAFGVALVVFPVFWVGFRLWWGWERAFRFVMPPGFWNVAVAQLVVVALPEEFFYRGYLLGRLNLLLRGRTNVWGAPLGWSLPLTSVLFAVGHYIVTFDPQRLAVFFPALLFGWIRMRRGSITAAVVFHALCNIFMDLLLVGHGIVAPQEYAP